MIAKRSQNLRSRGTSQCEANAGMHAMAGTPLRQGEELPVTRALAWIGKSIRRTLHGTATAEGGSFA